MSTDPTTALPRSAFLDRPGAVEASAPDAGVAAHYSNPLAEQRELLAGRCVVDLSHHGVVTVTGPDRLSWLDSMTSQALARLTPGESSEALLLGPTGRIEHVLRVLDDGTTAWLLVDAGEAVPLAAWLNSMRFMLRVEVADRSADFATIGWFAAEPGAAPASATGATPARDVTPAAPNGTPLVWSDPWRAVSVGGYQYASPDGHPAPEWAWRESLVERPALAELTVPAAGIFALEALRIAAWRPRFDTEVDDRTIPHELDWLRTAVHLTKGCYRGQETVAKVHNLGHPPRRLVMLHLDGSDSVLPAHGDEVLSGERVVGHVTSAALHFEQGPIALAVIKRNVEAGAALTVTHDGLAIAAAQQLIVPTDAGATADIPRIPRLGSR